MKTEDEVDKMKDEIYKAQAPHFTYQYKQGIQDALDWLTGDLSDNELLTGDEDER